jgi:hypothetical protein
MTERHIPFRRAGIPLITLSALLLCATQSAAQAIPTRGRFALFSSLSEQQRGDGSSSDFTELISMISFRSKPSPGEIFEFALDARLATYPSSEREERVSLYEAWVGLHTRSQAWSLRLGQMWLHELGGLGSIGGLFAEYRKPGQTSWGRWRFGLFAGYELAPYDMEYLQDIEKGGLFVALDGAHGRQHTLGYVLVRNQGLTERSVVSFSNFIPVGRSFTLYQALEYDTEGPAGLGDSELTYFFTNLRFRVSRSVDIQGTYHRGRSLDARTITEDVIDGRPVKPETLVGLLYESARLRLMVRPGRNLSVWAGYGADRNTRNAPTSKKFDLGLSARRILGSDADITISAYSTDRGEDSYDSMWGSIGYALSQRVYVSLDYRDTLSVYHVTRGDGGVVEIRPDSTFYSLSSNINLNRTFSLSLTMEYLEHSEFDERRLLTGLIISF